MASSEPRIKYSCETSPTHCVCTETGAVSPAQQAANRHDVGVKIFSQQSRDVLSRAHPYPARVFSQPWRIPSLRSYSHRTLCMIFTEASSSSLNAPGLLLHCCCTIGDLFCDLLFVKWLCTKPQNPQQWMLACCVDYSACGW